MIISGLIITLSPNDTAAWADAIESMRTRTELTLGELNERWLPVALDARDDEHSREVHDWMMALPGVEYVDVVSVHFDEPERGCVEDQPQHAEFGVTLRLVEGDTAALHPTLK